MFNRSLLKVLDQRPWRWNPPDQEVTKQTLNGVFILLSDTLIDLLSDNLTETQKEELKSWGYRVTLEEAGEWHVPVWAGEYKAVYIRVPNSIWSDPTAPVPQKVKNYFQHLWREIQDEPS